MSGDVATARRSSSRSWVSSSRRPVDGLLPWWSGRISSARSDSVSSARWTSLKAMAVMTYIAGMRTTASKVTGESDSHEASSTPPTLRTAPGAATRDPAGDGAEEDGCDRHHDEGAGEASSEGDRLRRRATPPTQGGIHAEVALLDRDGHREGQQHAERGQQVWRSAHRSDRPSVTAVPMIAMASAPTCTTCEVTRSRAVQRGFPVTPAGYSQDHGSRGTSGRS